MAGTTLGAALAWAAPRLFRDLPWRADLTMLLGGVALGVAVAVLVGVLGPARRLGRRPLPVLWGGWRPAGGVGRCRTGCRPPLLDMAAGDPCGVE